MVKARILHFSPLSSQHDISREEAPALGGCDTARALVESRTSRLARSTSAFASRGGSGAVTPSGGCLAARSTYSPSARFGTAPYRARHGRRIAQRLPPCGRSKASSVEWSMQAEFEHTAGSQLQKYRASDPTRRITRPLSGSLSTEGIFPRCRTMPGSEAASSITQAESAKTLPRFPISEEIARNAASTPASNARIPARLDRKSASMSGVVQFSRQIQMTLGVGPLTKLIW